MAALGMTPRSHFAMTPRGDVKVPLLPGNRVALEAGRNVTKDQSLTYGKGGTGPSFNFSVKSPGASVGPQDLKLDLSVMKTLADPFHRYDMSARSPTHEERNALKESARNSYCPAIAPAWLKHDRQVLRFETYFEQAVHENPKETFRIRCCTLYYYLEDGTIMISEPKVENSGIPQGTFIKRHRIPKPREMGGGFYTFKDLSVGASVCIYGNVHALIGCDGFTRDFYQNSMNLTMPENEEPPIDGFRAAELQDAEGLFSPRSQVIQDLKEFNSLAAGGSRRNEKLQQYLDNDRKVLRFYCYWDDSTRYGARNYYTLHYYLADDNVEMLENIPRNAGRDNYPTFWRKSVLQKQPRFAPVPGMNDPSHDIYKPEDLVVGGTILVMRREVFLYDCDEFTRSFYRQYMNHEQDSIPIEHPKLVHVKLTEPPHNGFGSPEDSLQNCKWLTPRPVRRDMIKILTHADATLRFEAKMVNPCAEDQNRRFIIGIFLADDHVAVWEVKTRNSGHWESKFAAKAEKINPATNRSFKPTDFYVGAILVVSATPFELTGADEAALKYMEERPDEFPHSSASLLVSALGGLRSQLEKLGTMRLPIAELRRIAQDHCGIELIDHELITLARAFGEFEPKESIAIVNTETLLKAIPA
eukprot:TRINITY_DN93985_c0_g1_i1.p1 TRINITY_DN93985_c0_g1~~TRINITY_DN93985_c0_g1_i1.p1  ORF type:complete len:679 (-),score=97.63 TRINITY_DN93985_c0_g1_i1:54-1979(-)